jgi:orotidine-5'-phosphate decarboxylase
VALDFPTSTDAQTLVGRLQPELCRLKVGKELFVRAGPDFVGSLVRDGFDVFLDLKFHDIPNTVAAACRAAADLGVWMVNVHVSGGRRMMEAAAEAMQSASRPPLLIGVTVLTSLSENDLQEIGLRSGPEDLVSGWAHLAEQSGLDGVVCSGREAARLRSERRPGFLLVTPGIRPRRSRADDQRRVMTPAQAVEAGVDYLVIGRPITAAHDPLGQLLVVTSEISDYPPSP